MKANHDMDMEKASSASSASGDDHRDHAAEASHTGHSGHGWMMIACCIPMLAIAIVLVATGVASVGLLFAAVLCTAMMAMMMNSMGHGDSDA
jgi:hypothetical protein